jgi:hypothetical protein
MWLWYDASKRHEEKPMHRQYAAIAAALALVASTAFAQS